MTRPTTIIIDGACPVCHDGHVREEPATTFDTYVAGGVAVIGRPLPTRPRETVTAACNACEFVVDLRHSSGVPKTSAQLLKEMGEWLNQKTTTAK